MLNPDQGPAEILETETQVVQEFGRADLRKPDFLIVGAMKGGTTTLFNWLKRHPDFDLPPVKEPWFFVDQAKWKGGVRSYLDLFAGAPSTRITGEASTGYSFLSLAPLAAHRIQLSLPRIRLIFLARNPASRLRSHYRHEVQRGREKRTLWLALGSENPYVDQSLYSRCLEPYLDRFPPEQICITKSEELFSHPHKGWETILKFLGARVQEPPGTAYNVSSEKQQFTGPMLWLWERKLLNFKRLPRPLRAFGRKLLLRNSDSYRELMHSSEDEFPAQITELLERDMTRLEEKLGRPLWSGSERRRH